MKSFFFFISRRSMKFVSSYRPYVFTLCGFLQNASSHQKDALFDIQLPYANLLS